MINCDRVMAEPSLGRRACRCLRPFPRSDYRVTTVPNEAIPKARDAARRALAVDDTLPDAHIPIADILWRYDWDWAAAAQEFKRALDLDPGSARTRSLYGSYLSSMGRHNESMAQVKRALEISPLDDNIMGELGWRLYIARRYDEATAQFRKIIDMDLDVPAPALHVGLSRVYEATGLFAEALDEILKAPQPYPEETGRLRKAFAVSGWKGVAREQIRLLKESTRIYVSPYLLAHYYITLAITTRPLHHTNKPTGSEMRGCLGLKSILITTRCGPTPASRTWCGA